MQNKIANMMEELDNRYAFPSYFWGMVTIGGSTALNYHDNAETLLGNDLDLLVSPDKIHYVHSAIVRAGGERGYYNPGSFGFHLTAQYVMKDGKKIDLFLTPTGRPRVYPGVTVGANNLPLTFATTETVWAARGYYAGTAKDPFDNKYLKQLHVEEIVLLPTRDVQPKPDSLPAGASGSTAERARRTKTTYPVAGEYPTGYPKPSSESSGYPSAERARRVPGEYPVPPTPSTCGPVAKQSYADDFIRSSFVKWLLKRISRRSPERYKVAAIYREGWKFSFGYNISGRYGDHAEDVAIERFEQRYGKRAQGGVMYCTYSPCSNCTNTLNGRDITSRYVLQYKGKL